MSRDRFSNEERIYFYDAIQYLDSSQYFVIIDKENDTLTYTDKINSHEKITGRPSDEELTRCLILLNLLINYGYNSENLEIEDSFSIGGRRDENARAIETDIIIKDENGQIDKICEVKKIHDYSGVSDSSIKTQLFDPYSNIVKYNTANYLFYLSCNIPISRDQFPLNCIGIDTRISNSYDDWVSQGRTPHLVDIIPLGEEPTIQDVYVKLSGDEQNLQANFKELNDNYGIDLLRRTWRILWDFIWGGTLEDNKKFENFNKVLLAKIYDERKTKIGSAYQFQRKFIGNRAQTAKEISNDVDLLYRQAYIEYLSKNKEIELKDVAGINFSEFPTHLISKCVEQLSSISFQKNRYQNVDILGEFYEMVIREAFKQTKGLFLTHPNIVLFILAVLDIENLVIEKLVSPDEDIRYRLPFVIDPSCGTGTFLIFYMQYVQKFIEENINKISAGDDDVIDFVNRQMLNSNSYKWVIDYVYGLDIERVLATACQINNILHGDGSTNIYATDGLDSFQNYSELEVIGANNILSSRVVEKPYYEKDSINKFDVVISNPPFNVNINKESVLQNFILNGKSEVLFLERWYQLLKPEGRLGVVLPESFFSVNDEIEGRIFLYKHFNLKAVVSLPSNAFAPHTNTLTSLLFASKKSEQEETEFQENWDKYKTSFVEKYSRLNSIVSVYKRDIAFSNENREGENNIFNYLGNIENFIDDEFGVGFAILPYFPDEYVLDDNNFNSIKKKIRDVVTNEEERWILHQIARENDTKFYNFSVSEIGYKAGKKGAKDRPNELMAIYNGNNEQIYNLKYAHSWEKIDFDDTNTVLGQIKELDIWQ